MTQLPDSVLVLGGTGFIGTHICNRLATEGVSVESFGRSALLAPWTHPNVARTMANVEDATLVEAAVRRHKVIVYLAGGPTPGAAETSPKLDLDASLSCALNVMLACRDDPDKIVIFISSGGTVYGDPAVVPTPESTPAQPISIYGIHKITVENYFSHLERHFGARCITLRLANPYGPLQVGRHGQGVVAALLKRALAKEPFEIWGDGAIVRDFVFIDDVVDAVIASMSYRGHERIFNVGSGRGMSVKQVALDIEHAVTTRPLEWVFHPSRRVDVLTSILAIDLISVELGWRPQTTWDSGLRTTAAWFNEYVRSSTRSSPQLEEPF